MDQTKDEHSGLKHKAKPKKRKKQAKKNKSIKYILAVLLFIAIVWFFTKSDTAPLVIDHAEQYGASDVTFYVMSQCPYGIQVENAIDPVLAELGDNINFRIEFIANENPDGSFNSLHGQSEVDGDKIQLCVQEHYPENMIGFVTCQNEKPQDLKSTVAGCAGDEGIDLNVIMSCAEGIEGSTLLSESAKKSQEANARGSPTIYIDGNLYQGARDPLSFKRAICTGLQEHPVCEAIPECGADYDCTAEPGKVGRCENPGSEDAVCTYSEDTEVKLLIVNAKECATCDTSQLLSVLKEVFFNMQIQEVDASSEKGQKAIDMFGLEKAPAYVFSGDMETTYAWQNNPQLRGAFKIVDDKYYVVTPQASGSEYIIDPEKRAEMDALTGVVKGDNRPQIDFYVMSFCPYGNIAEEAIEQVYQLLGGSSDFNPHYVIYSNYRGGGSQYCLDDKDLYCSMHGVQELNQGVRELCVDQHMGITEYFKFILAMNKECSASNADSCWEPVADKLGLDVDVIKECEANEWEDILSKELALNQALGVTGSPTVFVEGQRYSGSRDPKGFATALCSGFDNMPAECGDLSILDDGNAPAAPVGGCG